MTDLLVKYKKHFADIPSLYNYQVKVLASLQKRQNTLAIIPTGGGKSLLYQLMALECKGVTLVICPLIALMEEQVKELNKRNIRALALNSTYSFEQQREILRNLKKDKYKLIYLSPERLQNSFFRAALLASKVEVSLITIDEAHCISQWGASFRPDYSQINEFAGFLRDNGHSPFLFCLTATLSKLARKDIIRGFDIDTQNVIISGVIRDNLNLQVRKVDAEKDKSKVFQEFLEAYKPEKTVAYLYSQDKCEKFADEFGKKYRTNYYHASVDSEDKKDVFRGFTNKDIDILFATTAFGMGINIPDIESVVHLQIPNSIEEYYQQVGRGWRKKDVKKICNCLALWSEVNFNRRMAEIQNEKFTREKLRLLYAELTGGARIHSIGQVVNKDKETLLNSRHNLRLVKYKLEEYGIIRNIGEINGTPLTIKFRQNTKLWSSVTEAARSGMDSFLYVSKHLSVPIRDIIHHLFHEDLRNNISKLPATKRDIYFEVLTLELSDEMVDNIVDSINKTIEHRLKDIGILQNAFASGDIVSTIKKSLS